MTIKPNDFYTKLGELCNDNIMGLFYELTSYLFSSVQMENTDDIEYDFNHVDKRFYMIIIGKEDSIMININPEGIPKGDAVVYVEYRTRRRSFETDGRRIPAYDAGQWIINSHSCQLQEYEHCNSWTHFDIVQNIMRNWRKERRKGA